MNEQISETPKISQKRKRNCSEEENAKRIISSDENLTHFNEVPLTPLFLDYPIYNYEVNSAFYSTSTDDGIGIDSVTFDNQNPDYLLIQTLTKTTISNRELLEIETFFPEQDKPERGTIFQRQYNNGRFLRIILSSRSRRGTKFYLEDIDSLLQSGKTKKLSILVPSFLVLEYHSITITLVRLPISQITTDPSKELGYAEVFFCLAANCCKKVDIKGEVGEKGIYPHHSCPTGRKQDGHFTLNSLPLSSDGDYCLDIFLKPEWKGSYKRDTHVKPRYSLSISLLRNYGPADVFFTRVIELCPHKFESDRKKKLQL